MTDNTRVSDGNSAAPQRTNSDNFDRTELFNSFNKTRESSTDSTVTTDSAQTNKTDTLKNGTEKTDGVTPSTDIPSNKTAGTDGSSEKTDGTDGSVLKDKTDKHNGDRTKEANNRPDVNGDQPLQITNVFEELGLTRGLTNRVEGQQTEGDAGRDQSRPRSVEQQFPQITFFDSATASASSSARIDGPQRNRSREQQSTDTRRQGPRDQRPGGRPGDRLDARPSENNRPQDGLQVENLGASKEFANKVQKQINSLTPETRAALEKDGVEIVVTDKLTSVRPDLKGKEPYNQPGAKYENLDAFMLTDSKTNKKTIVIAETRENRAGKTVPNDRVEGVVKHEVGHALDASLGDFSQKPEFAEAHRKDTANLNPSDKNLFNYLVGSPDGDGKKEAFADVWGALNGASANPEDSKKVLEKFPNSAKLIKEKLGKFIK